MFRSKLATTKKKLDALNAENIICKNTISELKFQLSSQDASRNNNNNDDYNTMATEFNKLNSEIHIKNKTIDHYDKTLVQYDKEFKTMKE